jgi:membrane protease YdiL (CAAX protease family)
VSHPTIPVRDPDPPWPDRGPDWRHDAGAPEDAFAVPFTIFDALAMVLWTIIAQVLVVTAAAGLGLVDVAADLTATPVLGTGIQIAAQVVTLAGLVGYLGLRGCLSWRVLGPVRPRWGHVGSGVGLGLSGLVIVLTLAEIVNQAFGPFEAPQQYSLQVSNTSTLVLVMTAISAVLLAPVVEEVVFRSLLFQSVRRKLGLAAAMVIQALVFAYIHLEVVGNPPAIVGLVALALWLAGAFHRTGSLVVPVTAHATYNLTVLVMQAAAGVDAV